MADPSLPTVLLVARPGQGAVELSRYAREQGAEVHLQSPWAHRVARDRVEPDLIVVMGRAAGTESLVRRLLSESRDVPVVVVAAGRDLRRALGALPAGDVLCTPPGDTLQRTAGRLVDFAAELRSRRQQLLVMRSDSEGPPPPPPPPLVPDDSSVRPFPSSSSQPMIRAYLSPQSSPLRTNRR